MLFDVVHEQTGYRSWNVICKTNNASKDEFVAAAFHLPLDRFGGACWVSKRLPKAFANRVQDSFDCFHDFEETWE